MDKEPQVQLFGELEHTSYELLQLLDTEKDAQFVNFIKSRVDHWSEGLCESEFKCLTVSLFILCITRDSDK